VSVEQAKEVTDRIDSILGDALRAKSAGNRSGVVEALKEAKRLGVNANQFQESLREYESNKRDFGWLRSFAQGLSFGFADEVEAYGRSLAGGEDYDQELRRIRAGKAAFEGEFPVTSTAAEVAGALPSALLPFGLAARGAQAVGRTVLPSAMMSARGGAAAAPTFTGEAVKATAVGAGEGFLGGYGRGEGEAERLSQGIAEGVIGGVSAPIIQGAIGGLTRLGQSAMPVEQVAQQRIASTIPRGDEPRVAGEVAQRVAAGDEAPETLADIIGQQAQQTVKATRMGGEADFDEQATEFLTERMADAPSRVSQAVGEFGEGLGVNVFEELDDDVLRQIRDDAAYQAYQPLREANPDLSIQQMGFDKFFDEDMISESVYNKVVSDMRRLVAGGKMEAASIDGVPSYAEVKRAIEAGQEYTAPFAFFDQIQREMADIGRKGLSGETRTSGASYKGIANEMDRLLRQNIDGYAQAKSAFKQNSDVMTAAELGRKASGKSKTAQQVQKELSGLGEDARRAYVQSALNALVRTFDVEGRDYASRILKSRETKEKLRAMLGDQPDEVYENLLTRLGREARMARSGQVMTPRSDTAQNLAMMQEQGFDITQGPMAQLQNRLLEGVVSNLPSRRSAVTQRAGEMLLETSPQRQQQIISGVQSQLPMQRGIERAAVVGGRAARVPSLISPILDEERQGPVTIYTDEQMQRMGLGGLLR